MSKTKTLELAMAKAAELPDAAQEQIGRDVLERVETLAELRDQLEIGIRELNAGRGKELDIGDVMKEARAQHAKQVAARLVAGSQRGPDKNLALLCACCFA
jgi:hypothetical protein